MLFLLRSACLLPTAIVSIVHLFARTWLHPQAHYRDHGKMQFARCAFVIHNMAHQGRAPFAESSKFELPEEYRTKMFLNDPVGGEHMNILKAGLSTAHRLVAVSTGYAYECQTQVGCVHVLNYCAVSSSFNTERACLTTQGLRFRP